MSKTPSELKAEILRLTREYSAQVHGANRPATELSRPFEPGITTVPYAGRVFTEDEVEAAVNATLDFWLTLGPEGDAFEREFGAFLGVKHSLVVNSGSSANLLALAALTTHKLPERKRLLRGDEVITVAAGFPTTVAPIVQNGAVPVFIDNDPVTGNARVEQLEEAFAPGRTKAVMMAHTLGNPFDLAAVLEFCRQHDLWLIEDNCDALGSTYSLPVDQARALGLSHLLKIAETGTHPLIRFDDGGPGSEASLPTVGLAKVGGQRSEVRGSQLLTAPTGAWGDLSTQSFYPPHHITLGEGGAVNVVSHMPLKTYAESFRDWGRDCWCAAGKDNTCQKRYGWRLGELPSGYDHKYIYSHVGYNLKPIDPQAAIGRQQLKKLPGFMAARIRNWELLRTGLADLEEFFAFSLPTHAVGWTPAGFVWSGATQARSTPSWFGFMLRVRPEAPFTRREFACHLEKHKIGSRMLFGGNLTRQPAFVQLKRDNPQAFRQVGDLAGADELMHQAIFIGTYPGLTPSMLNYEIEVITGFVRDARKGRA